MTTKLTNLIRKFHSDEEGLEALQVVMIIAIAGHDHGRRRDRRQGGRHMDEEAGRKAGRQGPSAFAG